MVSTSSKRDSVILEVGRAHEILGDFCLNGVERSHMRFSQRGAIARVRLGSKDSNRVV